MLRNHRARSIFRLLSLVIYPIIFIFILILLVLTHGNHSSGIIKINQNSFFNQSTNPIYLSHLSDIHISPNYPNSEKYLSNILKIFAKEIKPDAAIFSGDLTDSYEGKSAPTFSFPHNNHWDIYDQVVVNSSLDSNVIFETLGNHDVWDLKSFDGSIPKNHLHTKIDNYECYTKTVNNIRLIGLHLVELPGGHGPMGFIATITPKMINLLEEELKKETKANITIVVTHHTTELMGSAHAKGKSGRTFEHVLKHYNVTALLNGHTHPSTFQPKHVGNVLEVTATSLKKKNYYQLMSYDNGQINYVMKKPSDPKAIVTYPGPSRLQTSNFQDTDFEIRLLSFSSKTNKNFTITGDIEGVLKPTREVKTGVWLYSMPAHFEQGIHKIKVSGDLKDEIEFAVNVESGPFVEKRKLNVNIDWIVVIFVLIMIYHAVLLFTMYIPNKFEKIWTSIVGGPLFVGSQLFKLPLWYRIMLTVMALWPCCLPMMIYENGGKVAMLWYFGYISHGKVIFDYFSLITGVAYMYSILIVAYDVALMQTDKVCIWNIADGLACFVILCVTYLFWYKYGADAAGAKPWWGVSITFIVFPIILIFVNAVMFWKYKFDISENDSDDIANESDDDLYVAFSNENAISIEP